MSAIEHEAVVLRTIKYGETDVIAHLFSRSSGRINAIARGALRPKPRYDARIEPFALLRFQLGSGRGELAHVRQADLITVWDKVRSSWRQQSRAAAILDVVARLSVPEGDSEATFHLLCNVLEFLDRSDPGSPTSDAIAIASTLKLMHLAGIAPSLGSCARGSNDPSLSGWSAPDGGVVGASAVEPGDHVVRASQLEAARWAMSTPLAAIAQSSTLPEPADMRWVEQVAIRSVMSEHAGFTPKPLSA